MKKNLVTTIVTTVIASGLLAFSSVSSAAPTWDFTDNGYHVLNGENDKMENGLRFVSTGGNISFNTSSIDPKSTMTPCNITDPYACDGDGLGIYGKNGGDKDELSSVDNQTLTISGFGGISINLISFLDTFIEGSRPHTEVASFFINDETMNHRHVSAIDATGTNGFVEWTGLLTNVNSITFLVDCGAFNSANNADRSCGLNDFSVAAINAVPVPAAVWLFGSGLIGLIGIARRRKAA